MLEESQKREKGKARAKAQEGDLTRTEAQEEEVIELRKTIEKYKKAYQSIQGQNAELRRKVANEARTTYGMESERQQVRQGKILSS